MKVSKFNEQVVSYDDRRSFQLRKGKRGIEVWMNGKHWMPPKAISDWIQFRNR